MVQRVKNLWVPIVFRGRSEGIPSRLIDAHLMTMVVPRHGPSGDFLSSLCLTTIIFISVYLFKGFIIIIQSPLWKNPEYQIRLIDHPNCFVPFIHIYGLV
jgi:hypothetical protein